MLCEHEQQHRETTIIFCPLYKYFNNAENRLDQTNGFCVNYLAIVQETWKFRDLMSRCRSFDRTISKLLRLKLLHFLLLLFCLNDIFFIYVYYSCQLNKHEWGQSNTMPENIWPNRVDKNELTPANSQQYCKFYVIFNRIGF